jgi:PKD repeat protein
VGKTLVRVILFCLFLLPSVKAQVACGYTFNYSTSQTYSPLPEGQQTLILASGATNPSDPEAISATDEDFFPNQPIGFSFLYNGLSYTTIGVATNGWIWFGQTNPVKAAGVVLPFTNILNSDTQIEGIISALNGDLEGRWTAGLASIRTQISGQVPNRSFTIEWNNFKAMDDAEGTGYCGENRNRFDFQIILEEQGNRISFAYNTAPYCWQGYEQLFQIGLRGNNRADVHTRAVSAGSSAWATSTQGANNATAILKSSSPTTLPAQNARFSFSPGAPAAIIWQGHSNTWNDPNNWVPAQVPSRCNDVTIPGGQNHYPELTGNQPASCANLIIQEGAALSLASNYSSFFSCYGNLINEGVVTNNTSSYLTLAGGIDKQLGGSGHFLGTDLYISAQSTYKLINDLVIRNLYINEGSGINIQNNVLDVFSIIQHGTLDQGTGILVIEGDAASVQLTDSTFNAASGTTFFGNGEVWANQVGQVVPSLSYNNLWVRTKKNFEVQLGTNEDFTCRNLLFYNPGEAGGLAKTNRSIAVLGNFKLGIDSLPGTSLQINHAINRVNGSGAFEMGKSDALNITHAPATLQPALTGFQNPTFNGNVTYASGSAQTIVNGTYTNLNITGSGVRTIQGHVNLKGVLKLEAGTLQTNDSLHLKSDSLGTGLISGAGNGILQGSIESERYIHGSGNQTTFLSSPVAGLNVIDYSTAIPVPGPDGVQWTQNSSAQVWEYISSEAETSFMQGWYSMGGSRQVRNGQGLQANLQGGSVIRVRGMANSGLQSIPVFRTGNQTETAGYNLLGNPYPSPIDWNKIAFNASQNISKSVHRMGASDRYNGNYATWLAIGSEEGLGVNGASRYIGIQEGFFVRAFQTDTLRLNNSYRAEVLDVRSVNVPEQIPFLRMSLVKGTKSDETLIYFKENASSTEAIDGQDALKMTSASGMSFWYSVKDSVKLAIQGRALTQVSDSIPLGIQAAVSGFVKLRLSEMVHFPATAMLFLEDRLNGTFQNLRQTAEYEVYLNEGSIENRFFIHYRPGVRVTAIKEGCSGGDGQITLNNPTSTAWDVQVLNSLDSLVAQRNAFTGNWVIPNLKADEYRVHFSLTGQNIQIDEWIQVNEGSGITASFNASATEVKMEEEEVVFTSTTQNAQSLFWNFGDGMMLSGETEVSHIFEEAGSYPVVLTAGRDECSDTAQIMVHVITITGIEEANSAAATKFTLFPNPATTIAYVKLANDEVLHDLEYVLVDAAGRIILQKNLSTVAPGQTIEVPVSGLSKGYYEVVVHAGSFRGVSRLLVGGK